VRCDVIIVGTGRTPRAGDLGLDTVGIELGPRGELVVDEHCRAGDGVWGLGDVTAVMPTCGDRSHRDHAASGCRRRPSMGLPRRGSPAR
jgi:pyruvate/2-oxoglutarate dehydrogenase complex dihydrolipoamide dehydrogenase (E3) component